MLQAEFEEVFRPLHPVRRTLVTLGPEELPVEWEYQEVEGRGSQRDEVLVLLPPLVGCCGLWFKQLSFFASLSASSSPHVLALSLPATTELESVAIALGLLLDALSLTQQIHLGGCGLGGYVAQLFCQLRPQRVTSLFLINSFCELPPKTFIPPLSILPSFLISSTFLDEIPMDADPRNRDACVFVKKFASELSGAHQAARLALLAGGSPLAPIKLRERFNHDERITIVESWDDVQLTEQQKAQLAKFYPEALLAYIKRGGSFPMLANPEEVNLHLQVHMRRNRAKKEK